MSKNRHQVKHAGVTATTIGISPPPSPPSSIRKPFKIINDSPKETPPRYEIKDTIQVVNEKPISRVEPMPRVEPAKENKDHLIKQEPAGRIVLKSKDSDRKPKSKKERTKQTVYYSSEDEETAETKKVYSNVSISFFFRMNLNLNLI